MSKKFFVATFGCRTNQADSAALLEDLLGQRADETYSFQEADIIVVNTCTVTHRADQQVRQLIRRLRRGNPAARLLVTGCYAQRDPAVLAAIQGVDAVVGNTQKSQLVQLSQEKHVPGQPARIFHGRFDKVRSIDLEAGTQFGGRTRPFVKIQDGCDAKCTYCIIPSVRCPSRSVPPPADSATCSGFGRSGLSGSRADGNPHRHLWNSSSAPISSLAAARKDARDPRAGTNPCQLSRTDGALPRGDQAGSVKRRQDSTPLSRLSSERFGSDSSQDVATLHHETFRGHCRGDP